MEHFRKLHLNTSGGHSAPIVTLRRLPLCAGCHGHSAPTAVLRRLCAEAGTFCAGCHNAADCHYSPSATLCRLPLCADRHFCTNFQSAPIASLRRLPRVLLEGEPELSKWSLSNLNWLGRHHPLMRDATLGHQLLLALGRVVSTKVYLSSKGVDVAANQYTPT